MAALLRLIAICASLLIAFGFVAFAAEETDKGSKAQVEKLGDELNTPAPSASTEAQREKRHGSVREAIDDANDWLLQPFANVSDSSNVWVQRLIPSALGLLSWGLGLMVLANYHPKPKREHHDWRAA